MTRSIPSASSLFVFVYSFWEEDSVPAAVFAFVAVEDGSCSERCDGEVWCDVRALAPRAESGSHTLMIVSEGLSVMGVRSACLVLLFSGVRIRLPSYPYRRALDRNSR